MQALLLVALAIAAVRGDVALDVSPVKRFPLNPNLHSIFFETEINYGCEGGLYAEMVANRDFETQGRGLIPTCAAPEPRRKDPLQPGLDPNEPPANPQDYRPWTSIGQAQLELTNSTQPFTTNPMTLKVTGRSGDGFSNPGYWGMNFELGESYHLSFYASSRNGGWVAVRFSGSSVANIFVQGEKWTKYEASIQALSTNHTGSHPLPHQPQARLHAHSGRQLPRGNWSPHPLELEADHWSQGGAPWPLQHGMGILGHRWRGPVRDAFACRNSQHRATAERFYGILDGTAIHTAQGQPGVCAGCSRPHRICQW
eukprot:m.122495 g.122495  ORF g.122495 m.122495 type:complete len:312 (-) comp9630_c0_seq1:935-1870(-)